MIVLDRNMIIHRFADFLFSITDNDFVFRKNMDGGGNLRSTSSFLDSLTQSAKVVLVFFTPSKGKIAFQE